MSHCSSRECVGIGVSGVLQCTTEGFCCTLLNKHDKSRSGSCISDFCLSSWIDNFIDWAWQIYIPYFVCPQNNKPQDKDLCRPRCTTLRTAGAPRQPPFCTACWLLSCGVAALVSTKLSCTVFLKWYFLNDSISLLLEGRALVKSFKWRLVTSFVMHGNDVTSLLL